LGLLLQNKRSMKFWKYIFSCILLLSIACTTNKDLIYGKVVRIADGDTVTLLVDGNKQLRVRLYGIDCPENKQDFSQVAKQFTSDRTAQKDVSVKVMDIDQYGRSVGIIYLPDGEILNEELLKAGLAWHYKQYDQSDRFANLENEARKNKLGIWSMKNPLEPWVFRRQNRR